jgi:hypothetical protein
MFIFNVLMKIKKILIDWILYKFYKNFIEIDKKFYTIWYFYNFKWYAIKIPKHRGPITKWEIFDITEKNITNEIIPYMGPNNDFYGMKITPNNLNYSNLIFKHGDTIKIFKENDNITL